MAITKMIGTDCHGDHSKKNQCGLYVFGAPIASSCPHLSHQNIAVAQSVERATPGEEVPGSIPAVAARSLLVGLVSV